MKIPGNKILIGIIFAGLLALSLPFPSAAAFVTCGGHNQPQCQFKDLVILIIRLINYLITTAALVAMYYVLFAGFDLIVAVGNPEKIERSKKALSNAVVGFGMVVLSFVFINLTVNAVLGAGPGKPQRPWWDPKCIYLDTTGCPNSIATGGPIP